MSLTKLAAATAVLVAGLAVPLSLAAPASAATKSYDDGVTAGVPGYGDLTILTVNNGPKNVFITIKIAHLVPDKTSAALEFVTDTGESESTFFVGTTANGTGHHKYFIGYDRSGRDKVPCAGLKVVLDTKHDNVDISFPQKCMVFEYAAGTISYSGLTQVTGEKTALDTTPTFTVARG